jgi:hypothetical protein
MWGIASGIVRVVAQTLSAAKVSLENEFRAGWPRKMFE